MWSLIQVELYKIFRRPRTYIAFGAVAALIVVIQLGLKIDGNSYAAFLMKDINDTLTVDGKVLNGYLICYILLQLLLVHVPLLVALIAADMLSGEANLGTLRLLFSTPFSRTQWVLAKFIAASVYTILLLIWLAFLALFVSMWVFGTDDLFLMKSNYVVLIEQKDVLWRYVGAFVFASFSLLTVTSLGFLMSSMAGNSIGPIVGTMSAIVFFTILSTLNIPLFTIIKPYLFTTHMNNWKEFFDIKVNARNEAITGSILNIPKIKTSLIVLTLHIILFVTASIMIMKKKDILS
ncbi:MAG: ABC transporter permease subunit [Chitinophagia bacterium]|jgi:ABC-2 type transport system permease protein